MTEPLANLPRHVAIIMDGNGRWAQKRFLPRYAGHHSGVESVRRVVNMCTKLGIESLTVFAFSSENWQRPEKEVQVLMNLFNTVLKRETKKLHKNNVRLHIMGAREAFSEKLQMLITEAETLTAQNTGLKLVVAANYGGRWDITQAAKTLAQQAVDGQIKPEDIDETLLNQQTQFSHLLPPDLFIRTGGDHRISNFLLWQLAYTELYFTDTLWPDFRDDAFMLALEDYASRQRRFGRTGEQVTQKS